MSNKKLQLSRRKTLAALGAIGAASAGAGFGTSAFFNDQETFENNRLVAGALDLKMDWEEHYAFPQIYDGFDDPTRGGELDVTRTDPIEDPERTAADYVGLPDPQDPVVWVHQDDFRAYFQNTTIEAYPDADGDPVEADFQVTQPCTLLADVPDDLGAYSDELDVPARTRNDDTWDAEAQEPLPLVNLADVKPGDYGEFTFSTHLCFNDGYLWMRMPGGLQESGGDTNDPEQEAMNAGATGDGELAENVQTALWYDDDCSNTINGEPEPLSAMALIDTSGSINSTEMQTIAAASNEFVEQLNAEANVDIEAGVMTFSDDEAGSDDVVLQKDVSPVGEYVDNNGNGVFSPGTNLLPSEGDGNTPLPHALDLAREVLNDRAQYSRKTILVISDGQPLYTVSSTDPDANRRYLVDASGNPVVDPDTGAQWESDIFDGLVDDDGTTNTIDETLLLARDVDTGPRTDSDTQKSDSDITGENGITIRTVGVGTQNQSALNDFLTALASDPGLFYNSSISQDLIDLTDEIIDDLNVVAGERVIFRGTLDELAGHMPIPIDGSPMTGTFDELNDPEDDPSRQPFDASSTQCFGLAWWLPASVGNEVQDDSVGFDLGFYAEQSRHNDDPGQTMGGT